MLLQRVTSLFASKHVAYSGIKTENPDSRYCIVTTHASFKLQVHKTYPDNLCNLYTQKWHSCIEMKLFLV